MTPPPESVHARRYLLGEASEEECAAIEQRYFEHEAAVDRIAAIEDELIEDYLADQLSPADRDRFERAYLSAPHHRVRVETVRRLMKQASRSRGGPGHTFLSGRTRVMPPLQWLALAASLILAVSAGLWLIAPFGTRPRDIVENRTPPVVPPPATPRSERPAATAPPAMPQVFAVTISSISVRSTTDAPAVVIPARTDIVALRLEGDTSGRSLVARRASIRTVDGRQIWQGLVATERPPRPGVVARIDVPASRLPADDYVITLYGTDDARVEQEWDQYVLRVRTR